MSKLEASSKSEALFFVAANEAEKISQLNPAADIVFKCVFIVFLIQTGLVEIPHFVFVFRVFGIGDSVSEPFSGKIRIKRRFDWNYEDMSIDKTDICGRFAR